MPRVVANGVTLHYQQAGECPDLVLIHGVTGDLSSWYLKVMPALARDAVYARMWEVLSGRDKQPRYRVLSLADRRAVVEILRATKPGLPDYFQPILN